MLDLYNDICINKKRNSNNYKKLLVKRDNLVKYYVNQIDTEGVKTIVIEDLLNVKYKSDFSRGINDKVSRWTYRPLLIGIEMMCEVKGIELVKVSPAYTSQTCSSCGAVHKDNRQSDYFKCKVCFYEIDSDYNASINIRDKGVYSPLSE